MEWKVCVLVENVAFLIPNSLNLWPLHSMQQIKYALQGFFPFDIRYLGDFNFFSATWLISTPQKNKT